MGDEAAQALSLMDRMLKLKEQGLQGEQITRHFIKSRLALIKERSRTPSNSMENMTPTVKTQNLLSSKS